MDQMLDQLLASLGGLGGMGRLENGGEDGSGFKVNGNSLDGLITDLNQGIKSQKDNKIYIDPKVVGLIINYLKVLEKIKNKQNITVHDIKTEDKLL